MQRFFIISAFILAGLIGAGLLILQKENDPKESSTPKEINPVSEAINVPPAKIDSTHTIEDRFLAYTIKSNNKNLHLFWKDDSGNILKNFNNLKKFVESKNEKLVFAMNGGMFQEDYSPLGLYIEKGRQISKLNTRNSSNGNFYLKPNGVFCLTKDNKAEIIPTEKFVVSENIQYATQSGPMLLINGEFHKAFKSASTNLNIRNGVGVKSNGEIVFVLSKVPVNFYEFAKYFKEQGCSNALFLDGFVSRAYLPSQNWTNEDGNFGVMIGVTEKMD